MLNRLRHSLGRYNKLIGQVVSAFTPTDDLFHEKEGVWLRNNYPETYKALEEWKKRADSAGDKFVARIKRRGLTYPYTQQIIGALMPPAIEVQGGYYAPLSWPIGRDEKGVYGLLDILDLKTVEYRQVVRLDDKKCAGEVRRGMEANLKMVGAEPFFNSLLRQAFPNKTSGPKPGG